jgi:hypothetical protein
LSYPLSHKPIVHNREHQDVRGIRGDGAAEMGGVMGMGLAIITDCPWCAGSA